jgi:hypothetical protein
VAGDSCQSRRVPASGLSVCMEVRLHGSSSHRRHETHQICRSQGLLALDNPFLPTAGPPPPEHHGPGRRDHSPPISYSCRSPRQSRLRRTGARKGLTGSGLQRTLLPPFVQGMASCHTLSAISDSDTGQAPGFLAAISVRIHPDRGGRVLLCRGHLCGEFRRRSARNRICRGSPAAVAGLPTLPLWLCLAGCAI